MLRSNAGSFYTASCKKFLSLCAWWWWVVCRQPPRLRRRMMLIISEHDAAHLPVRRLLCQDGSLHRHGALPHQAHLHRPAGDQFLHGEPRLHDWGTPPRPHVLLWGGRVQCWPETQWECGCIIVDYQSITQMMNNKHNTQTIIPQSPHCLADCLSILSKNYILSNAVIIHLISSIFFYSVVLLGIK